ncbi:MAG: hypothetical protein JWM28_646 [Chitinophagaceae bacterium]|nr:hypothetical protein [Chitinophagaceae bacterium]
MAQSFYFSSVLTSKKNIADKLMYIKIQNRNSF